MGRAMTNRAMVDVDHSGLMTSRRIRFGGRTTKEKDTMSQHVRQFSVRGRVWFAVLMVVAIVALAAPVGLRPAAAQDDLTVQTRVQFLHAGTGVGKVEIRLNGDKKVDNFNYGDLSDLIDIDPGAVELQINEDRRGINYSIFYAVYPVAAGNDYYVVISDDLVLGSVVDRSPIADGAARVVVTQASVDLPAVNVVATGSDVKFATQLSFPRSSDATSVPAGTYDIEVTLADTGETALTMPGVVLEGNKVYELVIMGEVNDDDHPLTITSLVDDTSTRATGTPESTPTS
jgi:hypothetical protein